MGQKIALKGPTIWESEMNMSHQRSRALAFVVFIGSLLGCTVPAPPPSAGPEVANMTCAPSGAGYVCQTPNKTFSVGTYGSTVFNFHFTPPPNFELTGNPRAIYSGQEVFDVQVLGWNANDLFCQWHTEGSKQLFGPGGWVQGYCQADARMR
jgi:hypothetical protein